MAMTEERRLELEAKYGKPTTLFADAQKKTQRQAEIDELRSAWGLKKPVTSSLEERQPQVPLTKEEQEEKLRIERTPLTIEQQEARLKEERTPLTHAQQEELMERSRTPLTKEEQEAQFIKEHGPPRTPEQLEAGGFKETVKGIAKFVPKTIVELSQIGPEFYRQVIPEKHHGELGIKEGMPTIAETLIPEEARTLTTEGQRAGAGVAEVVTFLIPFIKLGRIASAGEAINALEKATTILKTPKPPPTGVPQIVSPAPLETALEKIKAIPSNLKGAFGKLLAEKEAAGIAKKEIPLPKKESLLPKGRATAEVEAARLKETTPEITARVEKEIPIPPERGTPAQQKILSETYEKGIDDVVKKRGTKQVPKIQSANKTALSETMEEFGIKQTPIEKGAKFDFSQSSLLAEEETLAIRMVELVRTWKDTSLKGLNQMRTKLRKMNSAAHERGGEISRFGQKLYGNVRDNLGKVELGGEPAITKLNQQYSQTIRGFEEASEKAAFEQSVLKGKIQRAGTRVGQEVKLTGDQIDDVFNRFYDDAIAQAKAARDLRTVELLKADRKGAIKRLRIFAKEHPKIATGIAVFLGGSISVKTFLD